MTPVISGQNPTNRWTGATGSDFRIKRDPAKLLGSAVARSTQPFGATDSYARHVCYHRCQQVVEDLTMQNGFRHITIIVLLTVLCVTGYTTLAQKQKKDTRPPTSPVWEYKVVSPAYLAQEQ